MQVTDGCMKTFHNSLKRPEIKNIHHWIWDVLGYMLVLIKFLYPFLGRTFPPDKVWSAWTDMLLFLAKAWGGLVLTEGHVALLLKKEP